MRLRLTFLSRIRSRFLGCVHSPSRSASVLLCSAAVLAGCGVSDLDDTSVPPPSVSGGDGNRVTLSVTIPKVSSSSPGTRAFDSSHEDLEDTPGLFHVLLFKNTKHDPTQDADYSFDRFLEASSPGGTSAGTTRYFSIELPAETDPAAVTYYKVMIVANYRLLDEGADSDDILVEWNRLLAGVALPAARDKILFEQELNTPWPTTGTVMPLPMYGESGSFTSTVARVDDIPVVRAVARIDVGVNIDSKSAIVDGAGKPTGAYDLDSEHYKGQASDRDGQTFTLKSVCLYNSAHTGHIAIDPALYKAGKPSVDNISYHDHTGVPYGVENTDINMVRGQIYLPESPNKLDDHARAFHIVVGGLYGNDTQPTYYRIDFYDRTGGNPDATSEEYVKPTAANRYDILRNRAYVINILRVRGPGYANAELASQSEPVNMEVEVLSWDTGDNLGNMVTDGQYNLSVSSTRLRYHSDGTAQDLKVFTNYFLAANADASGWTMSVSDTDKDKLQFFDAAGQALAFDDVKRGAANRTETLRVGLTKYTMDDVLTDPDGNGKMERTIPIVFTAGRMSQTVELVQDVKNVNTLTLSPDRLSFPKLPKSEQAVILKSTPAGATYYVSWTDKSGTAHRARLNSDAVDQTVETARGSMGYLGDLTDRTLLPHGFGDCLDAHTDAAADASCQSIGFFVPDSGSGNMFSLRPSDWDARHNENAEPTKSRDWEFVVEAYWDDNTTPGASATLSVTQSHYKVSWDVVETSVEKMTDEEAAKVPTVDILEIDHYVTSAIAYFRTSPQYDWYFVSKSDEGNMSGAEWVTNWSDFQGKTHEGHSQQTIGFKANTNLQPRTVTFQASSGYDGFDRTSAVLKIRQKEAEPILELHPGVGVSKLPYTDEDGGKKIYTLDFGSRASRATHGLNVRANTDWWWEWQDAGGDPDIDRSEGTDLSKETNYAKRYGTPVFIRHQHPYWHNIQANPHKDTIGYVIGEWLGAPSVVTAPGKDSGTTDNGTLASYDKTWDNAFTMRPVQGVYLSPIATNDDVMKNRMVPHAGTYYSELKFYNKHDLLPTDDLNDPAHLENQGKIAATAKTLRIQRTVPSLFYSTLPYNNDDGVNLSNYAETDVNPGDPDYWADQRITFKANNAVTLTLRHTIQGSGTTTISYLPQKFYPRSAQGYMQLFDVSLGDMKGVRTDNNTEEPFIDAGEVNINTATNFHRYEVTISGHRQEEKDGPDVKFDIKRTYTSGYWMVHPKTPQLNGNKAYGPGGFTLILDFSESGYGRNQEIRLCRQKLSVGDFKYKYPLELNHSSMPIAEYTPSQVLDEGVDYFYYLLDSSRGQRYVEHTVEPNTSPTTMYLYWVEYLPNGDNPQWTTVWSDGSTGTTNQWGKHLFIQDAAGGNGLVFMENGPTVPAWPNDIAPGAKDTWINRGTVTHWRGNKEDMLSYSVRAQLIFHSKHNTDRYHEYYSYECPVTGMKFFCCACPRRASDYKEYDRMQYYLTPETLAAYNSVWPNHVGRYIFKDTRLYAEGKHWMVGSREHTRYITQHRSTDNFQFEKKCPDGHGIQREYIQEWMQIWPSYIIQDGSEHKGEMILIMARPVLGMKPPVPGYYNPSYIVKDQNQTPTIPTPAP